MTATARTPRRPPADRLAARAARQGERGRRLAATTAVLVLERRFPCFSRNVRSEDVMPGDSDVDPKLLHIRKDLLDPSILTEIARVDRELRGWLNTRAVECSLLAKGMWMIPLAGIDKVDERARLWSSETQRLARVLAREKYAPARAEARRRLGSQYDPSQYPSAEALEASFATRHRWISFNVPAALKDYSDAIARREESRVLREMESAADEIEGALVAEASGLIAKLAERLGTDPETGKPRIFRDDATAKLEEFFQTFAARNSVAPNERLAVLVEQARRLLAGIDPEQVRKSPEARAALAAEMQQVKVAVARLDVTGPKVRKFRAPEEV